MNAIRQERLAPPSRPLRTSTSRNSSSPLGRVTHAFYAERDRLKMFSAHIYFIFGHRQSPLYFEPKGEIPWSCPKPPELGMRRYAAATPIILIEFWSDGTKQATPNIARRCQGLLKERDFWSKDPAKGCLGEISFEDLRSDQTENNSQTEAVLAAKVNQPTLSPKNQNNTGLIL